MTGAPGRMCSSARSYQPPPWPSRAPVVSTASAGAMTTSASASAVGAERGAAGLGRAAGGALAQVVGPGVLGPVALQPAAEHGQQDADAAGGEGLEQRDRCRARWRGTRRRRRSAASATAGMVSDDVGERVRGGVAEAGGADLAGVADGDAEPFLDVLDLVPLGHARIRLGDAAHGTSVANLVAAERPSWV